MRRNRSTGGIKISADALAKMFGISTFDDILEYNFDYMAETAHYGIQSLIEQGELDPDNEEEVEEKRYEIEQEVGDGLYRAYLNALDAVVEAECQEFEMDYERDRYDNYILKPARGKTWKDVAANFADTISGEGYFAIYTAKELLDTGPYKSYKEAIERHLRYMNIRYQVYGYTSPSRHFDREFDHEVRYHL